LKEAWDLYQRGGTTNGYNVAVELAQLAFIRGNLDEVNRWLDFEGLEEFLLSPGVIAAVDRLADELTALSRKIWELAEVGLQEHRSAEAQAELLEQAGFEVQRARSGHQSPQDRVKCATLHFFLLIH